MKKLVLVAGIFSASVWAMDTIQVKRISDAEFESNRKSRIAAMQQRRLFKKTPQEFEKAYLFHQSDPFKGLSYKRSDDEQLFDSHIHSQNPVGVVQILQRTEKSSEKCPVRKSFMDICANRTDGLYFDPNLYPAEAYMGALLAGGAKNKRFLKNYKKFDPIYQPPFSLSSSSSSSSSGEDNSDDF